MEASSISDAKNTYSLGVALYTVMTVFKVEGLIARRQRGPGSDIKTKMGAVQDLETVTDKNGGEWSSVKDVLLEFIGE